MNADDFPAPRDGFVLTNFLVVSDQDRSREFYRSLFDAQVVVERDLVIMNVANSWLILNVGSGPTDDKHDQAQEAHRGLLPPAQHSSASPCSPSPSGRGPSMSGSGRGVHDPKVRGNRAYFSWYRKGVVVADISNVRKPKEIAYYVAPAKASPENQEQASNYAMSKPAFAPKRHEVWFTDNSSGFYALRVDKRVWPR